mgnify:CR=1 FL=1
MKVKRLEIQGFKSFKDKTVIHFDDGVTGVVGPNGCGKSNIVDSFFWVMGEQSMKHLRGSSSGDLIFSGSEKYAPGNLAEVTMVLSTGAPKDVDGSTRDLPAHMRFQEISITRRLHRSGESEYLINGQQCRLKDVNELFMDTGAGPKAYSIIEQGQISKIVASKPEDRRVLIEEAAGITKFKARKKESMRKIEATQTNLSRINDIIAEIERQLNSLERQAAKARQYKVYKEEMRDTELLVGRKRLYGLQSRIVELKTSITDLEAQESGARVQLETAQVQVETMKLSEVEFQCKADDSLASLQVLQKELSSLQTRVELHKRTILEAHNASENLDAEKIALSRKIESAKQTIADLEVEAAQLKSVFENADGMLREHQLGLDAARSQADALGQALETQKKELMGAFTRQNEFSNQVHGIEARVDSLSVRLNQLTARLTDREMDLQILTERETRLGASRTELFVRKEALTLEFQEARAKTAGLDTELKELRSREQRARTALNAAESRAQALQQLTDSHEGFQADVKNLLSDESLKGALRGLFADVLEAHPGYEYALESALRDVFEAVFVTDAAGARGLLSRMKEENRGRATFWALDLLAARAAALTEQAQTRGGLPGQGLTDVVRVTHEQAPAILAALSRYRVVDDLDAALAAAAAAPQLDLIFVTREGDTVDSSGRIAGGSTRALAGGILARKAELQRLHESITALSGDHVAVQGRMHEVEVSLAEWRERSERLGHDSRDADIQASTVDKEWSSVSEQAMRLKREVESEREERQTLEGERAELWGKLDGIRIELKALEEVSRSRQGDIDGKTAEFNRGMEKCAELQASLIQIKVDATSAREKYGFSQEKREALRKEIDSFGARFDEINRVLNNKLDEKDGLQSELMELEESLQNRIDQVQAKEDDTRSARDSYERARKGLNELMGLQKDLMKTMEESGSELNRQRLECDRGSIEYQGLLQGLFERYALDESSVGPDPAFGEISPAREKAMMEEVESLRERIRRLGEVNVLAVDEYDEQKKRHEFLSCQRDDLLRSIADLEKAIVRINLTSEERFVRAFHEINKRFQQIFPLVFGGGSASLELTNPEDMAETGVEIMAEPPGKKVGSIQLLSGGEKALTAVALIFSIFLIKPSPFCVLDEVDAPLDDHNVGKFNMLLKEMAARSQFIIITHNKRTMELNNKLYGVTMEEPGVSKMVSIEMR